MPTPLLLMPFEGSLAGQDRDGPVMATGNGTITYDTGASPGTQAVALGGAGEPPPSVTLAPVGTRLSHHAGTLALRFAPHTETPPANQQLFRAGSVTSGAYVSCYQGTSGGFVALFRTGGVNTAVAAFNRPTLDAYTDRIIEWDATAVVVYGPSGLITQVARTGSPSDTWSTNEITWGTAHCHLDSCLTFDTRLTDGERSTLIAADTWAWDTLAPTTSSRIFPVLKIGTNQRIGPLRVGERN